MRLPEVPLCLSISCENGRCRETYGVNLIIKNIMKFSFRCLVILTVCSVCASGDLEIFPGYKFRLSPEEYRRRLSRSSDEPYGTPYGRWPWQDPRMDDYSKEVNTKDSDFEFPMHFRHFDDFVDKNTNTPDKDDEIPLYYNPRESLERAYETFRNRENNAKFGPYQIHSNPMLSDVRPYPQDDDFTFQNDDESDELAAGAAFQSISSSTSRNALNGADATAKYNQFKQMNQKFPEYQSTITEDNNKHNEEASGKGSLEEAKLVDDPTEFAYAPPDPRFYESSPVTEAKVMRTVDNGDLQYEEGFKVMARTDQEYRQNHNKLGSRLDGLNGEVNVEKIPDPTEVDPETANIYIIAIVAGISAAATVGLAAVGIGWYKLQKHVKNTSDVEYPAYGVTGPNKDVSPSGDRKLAQSAQMYHYQHQKQQIVAMESRAAGERRNSNSDVDSDEENEEGDYTVYECPGLAPTGEMEVKNPLFQDDQTPIDAPQVKIGEENQK